MFFCISSGVDELSSMTRSDSMGRFNLPNSNYMDMDSNHGAIMHFFVANTMLRNNYTISAEPFIIFISFSLQPV
jgi:hypothetical protein